jgi:pimeloyl-ACP methyl ester carboxylesterase
VVAAPLFPISGSPGPGPAAQDVAEQPKDLSAVITAVLGPNAPAAIAGKVDGTRIAAAGHSDGGSTVAALALDTPLRDTRVDSYLVLSGALPPVPGPYDGQNTGPVLVVQGDRDPYNSVDDARPVYAFTANPPKAFVVVSGGGHTQPYLDDGPQPDAVRAATVDWLNLTLKGDASARARFKGHADSPGTTTLESFGL